MRKQSATIQFLCLAATVAFAMFTLEIACCQTSTANAKRLNVVFILADDLGRQDIGCYGQQKIPTPNIDRLASEGMRFTRHYSGAPVCAPSRCVLMTGKHLGHAEIRGNLQAKTKFPEFTEGQYPLTASALTIANRFQEAGYATGAFGKWGLGPVGSTGAPDKKGFQEFFGYNCQAVAHSYYPSFLWHNNDKFPLNTKAIPGHAKRPEGKITAEEWIGESYAPYRMIEEAEKFIAANKSNPFFLYLPFIEPHVAMHPPKASYEKFPSEWDQREYRGGNGYLPHPRPRAAYAAMVHDLDTYVGRVLQALDTYKLTDNTLVIFTSDNGATHNGAHEAPFHIGGADMDFFQSTGNLRGYKGSVYEGGIRVPMIAKLPNIIEAGAVTDCATYFADWFPTLCEAVEFSPPIDSDGESFWSKLTNKDSNWRRKSPMIWIFPEYGGQVAIQDADWKLVRVGLTTKKPSAWELYHVSDDPSEERDDSALRPDIVQRLAGLLREANSDNSIFPVVIPD
ncbi:MAG: arylsulfatase [Pirellula sp.]|jgi:arylsulfatase A|nr:arylsulfatase [Pirellula sp.]